MAEGDAIKQVFSNPVNWLAGLALGIGGVWLGSTFSTTGWVTGVLGFWMGITGTALVTQAVGFHPFQVNGRKAETPQPCTKPQPSQAKQSWVDVIKAMDAGDLVLAEKAGIEELPIARPEELGLRGKFRFRRYLQRQTLANQEINTQDNGIKAAIADLVKANTAEAYLELVEVHLCTGDLDEAERTAKKGQVKFGDRRFETAVMEIRLEKAQPKKPRPPRGTQEQTPVPSREAEPNQYQPSPQSQATPKKSADTLVDEPRTAAPMRAALREFVAQVANGGASDSQGILPFSKKRKPHSIT
jgi:hypothetical protein